MSRSATDWVEAHAYEGVVDITEMVKDGLVIVYESKLNSLEEDRRLMECLQACGVDNWDGYEYAQEMMEE